MANIKKRAHSGTTDIDRKERASSTSNANNSRTKNDRDKNYSRHESDNKKAKRSDSVNDGSKEKESNSRSSREKSETRRRSRERDSNSRAKREGSKEKSVQNSNSNANSGGYEISSLITKDTSKMKTNFAPVNFDEKEYYQNQKFDQKSWLEKWNATISTIKAKKAIIKNEPLTESEKNTTVNEMLVAILNMKRLNREIQYQIRMCKDECKEVSVKCDQEDVLLQNVIYEQKKPSHVSKTQLTI